MIEIRDIQEQDLQEISNLYSQFWGEESDASAMKMNLHELKEKGQHVFLCATNEGRIVGTIMGVVCGELYGTCRPFLVMENLVTDKNYRNNGVGRSLLREFERVGSQRNCSQIIFITERNREEAISFYKVMGYNAESHIGFKKSLE